MRSIDALKIINDVNDGAKVLVGGLYQLIANATWNAGNVKVQQLGPDGSTWLDTGVSLTANGVTTVYLAAGVQARLVVTTATGVYAALSRVPGD